MPLHAIRLTRGLTYTSLAERAGISARTIGNVERGAHLPTLETMTAIAKALDVSIADIDEFQQRLAAT